MNSLEGGDGDVGNVSVQLVDAVLVFVTLAGESEERIHRENIVNTQLKILASMA